MKRYQRTVYFDEKHNRLLDQIYGIFLGSGKKKTYTAILEESLVTYYRMLKGER